MGVLQPVLVGTARQVGRQLGHEQVTEVGVLAIAKDLPEVLIGQGSV